MSMSLPAQWVALTDHRPAGRPRRPRLVATATACLALVLAAASARGEAAGKVVRAPHVTAQLLADREAVVPGEPLSLLVSLTIEKGWHIYWRSPGMFAGLPTTFEWALPEGYLAGRTLFPVPEVYHGEEADGAQYIHRGKALFVTPIRVPETAESGKDIEFIALIDWLVCKDSCEPGSARVSLTLPVVARGTPPKLANEELFETAREGLPKPGGSAAHIKIAVFLDRAIVKPGDEFTAHVTVVIEDGHHMQSNAPTEEWLIPAVLFIEWTAGLEIGEPKFPPAQVRDDPELGRLSEFSGKIEIGASVTASEDAGQDPRWIRGILQYQICTDAGTCYPPEHVTFAIPVRMEGGPAPGEDAEEWAAGAAPPPIQSPPASGDSPNVFVRLQDRLIGLGFLGVVIAGFVGGLLLNLMPCVLPVISLKVLSFVRQAQEDRARIFRLSLTYAAGIVTFFALLAYLLFAFEKGWGELFQNTVFVILMAAVVLAFSLSLFGVFTVLAPTVVGRLGEKAEGEGYASAFFTGVLATLLGTACTAPFLSAAVALAAQKAQDSPIQAAAIFMSVGFGMAFPFVLLGYKPAWVRFVPKPGPWFHAFEAAMGFLLLATVVWLLNPLRGQIGDYGLLLSLIFLLSVAVAVWIKGQVEYGAPPARKVRLYGLALAVLAVGWLVPFQWMSTIPRLIAERVKEEDYAADGQLLGELLKDPEMNAKLGKLLLPRVDWSTADGIPWQPYRRARAMLAVRHGYTVFVDYTADWCASCKTNLKSSIDREETIRVMRELNVVPYEADYTLKRPEIAEDLRRFGRAGVPLYLVYKPGDTENPEVLPELLTPGLVIDALRRAGPSQVPAAAQTASVPPD